MSENKITGIVDVPVSSKEQDKLHMGDYEQALKEFVSHTQTPITIAIQGEWGSGKTSLLNRIESELCLQAEPNFYGVWINTWQYSLLQKQDDTLRLIIEAMLEKVLQIARNEHPEKLKTAINNAYTTGKNLLKGLSKVAVKTAVSQLSSDAAQYVDDALFEPSGRDVVSINDLRLSLEQLINQLIEKNVEKGISKQKFIFIVDDLDRVNPETAVQIMELMKNIFDLKNCIFILAIDYDVVVKGLKSKFGELTKHNEREFRQFFDKIIQLPFRMPTQAYVIDDFLKDNLLSIQFLNAKDAQNTDFLENLVRMANFSVGTNPRNLKRMINTLSFVFLLMKRKHKGTDISGLQKQILYGLVCLQISFPEIYNMVANNWDIENWNDEFATRYFGQLQTRDKMPDTPYNFTQKWQQIVFRAAQKNEYLSRNAFNIIALIKTMQEITVENNRYFGEILADLVSVISITSVNYASKQKLDINNVRVLYALNNKLLPKLSGNLKPPWLSVGRVGKMIAKLNYEFRDSQSSQQITLRLEVKQDRLFIYASTQLGLFESQSDLRSPIQQIEDLGKLEFFNVFVADFIDLEQEIENYTLATKPAQALRVKKSKVVLEMAYQTSTESPEQLYMAGFVENLSKLCFALANIARKMQNGEWIRTKN